MNRHTLVTEIMSKHIVALTTLDDLQTAEKMFKKYKIKHMPVVNNESIIGILSYTDLLKISYADISEDEHNVDATVYNMFTIEQVMAKNVITISTDTTIKEATDILTQMQFHALPIVEGGVVQGIVTSRDLLKYYAKQY